MNSAFNRLYREKENVREKIGERREIERERV